MIGLYFGSIGRVITGILSILDEEECANVIEFPTIKIHDIAQ